MYIDQRSAKYHAERLRGIVIENSRKEENEKYDCSLTYHWGADFVHFKSIHKKKAERLKASFFTLKMSGAN